MQVILSVVLAFIVCWLPYNILELIDTLMRGGQVMETCELRDRIEVAWYVTQAMAFTKRDIFLDQHLCWPWNNIAINQSDLKNKFIMFVKFKLTISVCC